MAKRGKKKAVEAARAMTVEETARAEGLVAARSAATLDERSVYVSLTQSAVGIRRRVAVEDVAGEANGVGPDRALLHVAKDIFDAKELREIQKAQREIHGWLHARSYPSAIRDGVRRLPLSFVEPMVRYFDEKEAEARAHVEAFLARYEAVKASAQRRLGALYDAGDYPEPDALRAAFRTTYYFAALGLPEQLNVISRDLYRREAEKAAARAEEERAMVVTALRQQFAEVVTHMAAILEPGLDGKARRFRESSVEQAREFLSMFDARNIGGDEALRPMVERARQLLEGVDAAALKSDADLRRDIRGGFERVREALTGMVTLKASRAVRLE